MTRKGGGEGEVTQLETTPGKLNTEHNRVVIRQFYTKSKPQLIFPPPLSLYPVPPETQ